MKDAAGKDVTVTGTEKTDYTYTGNGTYIPTFTKTVNVKDEEVEWKHTDKKTDYGVRTEEEAVAKENDGTTAIKKYAAVNVGFKNFAGEDL